MHIILSWMVTAINKIHKEAKNMFGDFNIFICAGLPFT